MRWNLFLPAVVFVLGVGALIAAAVALQAGGRAA